MTTPTREGRPDRADRRPRPTSVPTDAPESDGTFAWNPTTLVVVEATAGDAPGSATPTPTRRPPR